MAGAVLQISGLSMAHVISRQDRSRPSVSPLIRSSVVTATMMRSKQELQQLQTNYWASINADIEKHLHQALKFVEPPEVSRPLHHLTFSTPRSTAPPLCVASCELVGGRREDAVTAAACVHLLHAAFFAHDHVQLSGPSRPRPRPSLNPIWPIIEHAYSPGIELMTGDAMIPLAFELLATSADPTRDTSGQILQVMREIGRVTGAGGMIYGQYLKKDSGQMLPDVERLVDACEYHEGVLHACAGACGAILGGGGEGEVEKVRKFGGYVGKLQGLRMLKGVFEEFGMDLTGLVDQLQSSAITELEGFDVTKVEEIVSTFTKIEEPTD